MSSRQHYHEALWACFEAQTYPNKELVVLETYKTEPSPFLQRKAAEDQRLVHVCIKVAKGEDFSVGLKRNMTLHMASGEVCVNFDDDDLYAPCYVATMVNEMRTEGLHAVTLASWFNYYVTTGQCTYSEPSSWDDWADDEVELDKILYGYGFSYAHRRNIALEDPYPNVRFAEDAPFLLGLRGMYGEEKVGLMNDERGICVHIMHRANSAEVLGTRDVDAEDLDGLDFAGLKPFIRYRAAAEERLALGVLGRTYDDIVNGVASLVKAIAQ